MTIEEQLTNDLKKAMREKDTMTLDCVRMVKTRITEKRVSPDFKGEMSDDICREVVGAYVKFLKKGIDELKCAGEKSRDIIAKYQFEIDFLSKFLPQMLSEEETRKIINDFVSSTGASSVRDIGKVMGAAMKEFKGKIEPGLAKKIAEELLSGQTKSE
ncbi:MAG: GatB/YqeY domain-containing protein [Deltaproteobacteria bacterium]|nr:GatB/YqeY domain-containing protein [Deltaproteobacteria bacterium]